MRTLILFGFKGSGKTHLGKRFSELSGLPFIDTDDLLLKKSGFSSITKAYQFLQNQGFRAVEKEIISLLQPSPPAIISLGGGSVFDPDSVKHLQTLGPLVHIKTPFSTIVKRLSSLPPFAPSLKSLQALYEERLPLYKTLAHYTLDTEHFSEAECLNQLLNWSSHDV